MSALEEKLHALAGNPFQMHLQLVKLATGDLFVHFVTMGIIKLVEAVAVLV
jgi:hypothetical protein